MLHSFKCKMTVNRVSAIGILSLKKYFSQRLNFLSYSELSLYIYKILYILLIIILYICKNVLSKVLGPTI